MVISDVELEQPLQSRCGRDGQRLSILPTSQLRVELAQHAFEVGKLALPRRRHQKANIRVADDVAQVFRFVAGIQVNGTDAYHCTSMEQQQVFKAIRHQQAEMVAGL